MAEKEKLSTPEENLSETTDEAEAVSRQLKEMAESLEGAPKSPEEISQKQGKDKEGFIGELRKKVQGTVNEQRLPSEDYESTMGVYGGRINYDKEGRMVLDRRGIVSKIDKAGDAVLRTFDEHTVKEPWKLLKSHPKWALKFLAPGPKRHRGSNEEFLENIERLGLSEYYGPHENGIEIKKPEVFTKGIHLQDAYRSDLINSEKLKETDRFQALAEASKYVRGLHDKYGGVGELNIFHIIFQKDEDGKLEDPVLYIPDIVWNKEKNTSEKDKKTTDMLDLLSSVFVEEHRRSQNPEDEKKALDTVISNYGDKDIIALVESFIKRGRLTLQGDAEVLNLPNTITKKARGVLSQHNKARIGSKTDFEGEMKEEIKQACERFLSQK